MGILDDRRKQSYQFQQEYVYVTFLSQTGCSIHVKSQFTSEDQKDANIFSDQEHDAQEREEAEKRAKLDAIE